MKIFWGIVVALLIGFGALLLLRDDGSRQKAGPVQDPIAFAPPEPSARTTPVLPEPTATPSPEPNRQPDAPTEDASHSPEPAPAAVLAIDDPESTQVESPVDAVAEWPAEPAREPEVVSEDAISLDSGTNETGPFGTDLDTNLNTDLDTELGLSPEVQPTQEPAPVSETATAPQPTPAAHAETESLQAESSDTQTLRVLDGRFTLSGSGTPADPYLIPWELLQSAKETYNPRAGQSELPAWTQSLQGKHVRLSGHLLAPVVASETSELLAMMNQWDGCCIGVPPTPYNAVEVKFAQPLSIAQIQMLNFGAIEGVLDTDPYLYNEWLLGLYVIREAKLTPARP